MRSAFPGFQFIQDPLDYSTITHHSSMDTYDHLMPADLMQASAVIASMVYDAANAPEMFPRKPLPEKETATIFAAAVTSSSPLPNGRGSVTYSFPSRDR